MGCYGVDSKQLPPNRDKDQSGKGWERYGGATGDLAEDVVEMIQGMQAAMGGNAAGGSAIFNEEELMENATRMGPGVRMLEALSLKTETGEGYLVRYGFTDVSGSGGNHHIHQRRLLFRLTCYPGEYGLQSFAPERGGLGKTHHRQGQLS